MRTISYLALGDSYTIGEAVNPKDRFPHVLAHLLSTKERMVSTPHIIATTGWTTDELLQGIADDPPAETKYNLVSLLIGVNNQYRGFPMVQYTEEFTTLLNKALAFADGDCTRVFVVSIPDWGVTPFAAGKDRNSIAQEIDAYNIEANRICDDLDIAFCDITDISRLPDTDQNMIASDGLHPSAVQYKLWAKRIQQEVFESGKCRIQ